MKTQYVLLIFLLLGGTLAANPYQDIKKHRRYDANYSGAYQSVNKAEIETGFDVQKYTITLSIEQDPNYVCGYVLAEVLAETDLQGISYNLEGLEVSSVEVNGVLISHDHTLGIVNIPLNVQAGEVFSTKIYYAGSPQLSGAPYNVGMYFRTNSIFTVSDPDAARYWWPCYDHPWDKAIIDLIITMRDDWKVAANGLRESIVNNGDGTATTTWRGQNPMTTYLACITAADYMEISQTALQGELPILNFVSPSQYNNALLDLANLPDMIDYYSELFGEYPFEKYGNATVNMSTFAAMEHQTMTTLGNFIIDGNGTHELTIAHELVHQWFGNAVSFLDFNDVWLSEGFATYGEHLWTDMAAGWQAACDYVQNSYHQYYLSWVNNHGPSTIYDPAFSNYFAPPSYEKAASVLHMLRLKMGNDLFFELLQTYFQSFKHGNAITEEFKALAEDISGLDLDQFFEQWIYGSGIPSVEYGVFYKAETNQLKVIATSSSSTTTQFEVDIPFQIVYATETDSVLIVASPEGHANIFAYASEPLDVNANHNHWTLLSNLNASLPELNTCLSANASVVLGWNEFPNAIAYNIFRREDQMEAWQQVNTSPITELIYTDFSVTDGHIYEYAIRSIDIDGYQSLSSLPASVQPVNFSFAQDILIVDESRDGNGSSANPNDIMVDDFYNDVILPYTADLWDIAADGLPGLDVLGSYKVVIWHDDDFATNQINNAQELLSSYLFGNGKLIVSGWKSATVLSEVFWQRFISDLNVYYDNQACLISAESDSYPQLEVDAEKLISIWNGMLPMINSFSGDITQLYEGVFVEGSAGEGMSLAFRSGNLNYFGFPLYFMQQEGVRELMQMLLPELLETSNDDLIHAVTRIDIHNYPNPFNPHTNISFVLPQEGQAELSIFNIKGQKIDIIATGSYPKGKNTINYNASKLAGGVYILELRTADQSVKRRITLLK